MTPGDMRFPTPDFTVRRRVLASGIIGNVLEWYDFALYGYFAPVIAHLFFPSSDPLASLINAYGVFALGFLTRPLGGMLFGQIGDCRGRRALLTTSIVMMALPTTLMGMLPTYAEAGIWAPVFLCLLRLLQGLSTGGEFIGSITFLVEHAPSMQRGSAGSWANSGAMLGGLLGAGVGWLLTSVFPEHAVLDGMWRIPFLTGIVVGGLGLCIRLGVPDSPIYARLRSTDAIERKPLRSAFGHPREIALTFGLNWVVSVGYYVVFVWFVTDMNELVGLTYHLALGIGTLGLVVGLIATLAMGYLSDRLGPRPILVVAAAGTTIGAVPLLLLAGVGTALAAAVAQVGLALLVAAFLGALPAVFVSLFPVSVRCSGLALGYNLAPAVFGGTAPLVATFLIQVANWQAAPGLYLAATALVFLVLIRFVPFPSVD